MESLEKIIELLKDYFSKRDDVLMAFVFGSYAKGRAISESDFDVAVYLKPKEGFLKETKIKDFRIEDKIWSDVSQIVKKEVNLVCLNYAPATLVSEVIKTGIPLAIKDKRLYWEIYLRASLEAEDFLRFAQDYFEIYKKARSLMPEHKTELLKRFQFLDSELKEIKEFEKLTFEEYQKNKDQRRIIERWAENVINATIDITKIVLASEQKPMPRSYEEALRDFGLLAGLSKEESEKFSFFANLRNILAHEYLDVLYERIQSFIKEAPVLYKEIFNFLERYLSQLNRDVSDF